jgi:uncharacterized membrane protein
VEIVHHAQVKWRGHEVTRVEALSDAIFAFAVTLMVVSLEVPKTFDELSELMKGFIPFAICFAIFFQIWSNQNLFFRRYGLHDNRTLTLNAILLFVVLFFVYPMKFLWAALFHFHTAFSDDTQVVTLFAIYSAGFATIHLLYALMYRHACNMRSHLKLTDSESFETVTYVYRNMGIAAVGLIAMAISLLGAQFVPFAGMSYALIGIVVGVTHSRRGKLHRARFGEMQMLEEVVETDKVLEH